MVKLKLLGKASVKLKAIKAIWGRKRIKLTNKGLDFANIVFEEFV